MPKQNRVTPAGELLALSTRCQFMGNRGVLHNDRGDLTEKRWTHQQWIICLLEFKGRKRELMAPGCYTELFFLDEATALAAGHRPCFECNRDRYNQFKTAWLAGNPVYGFSSKVSIREIDKILHAERVDSRRQKGTWQSELKGLPDGVFVSLQEEPENCYLIRGQFLHLWTPDGYGNRRREAMNTMVAVLTPKSTVNAIRAGFSPLWA